MITYFYNTSTGELLSPILGAFSLSLEDLPDGVGVVPVPDYLDVTGCIVNVTTATLITPDETALAAAALLNTKEKALKYIDRKAGSIRSMWVSDGVGQQMVYQKKSEEAAACLADNDPQASDYPHLYSEVGITGDTLLAVAEAVSAKSAQWVEISAAIEAIRLSVKDSIRNALTEDQIKTIIKGASWPTPE